MQFRFNHEVITPAIKIYIKDTIFILMKEAEHRWKNMLISDFKRAELQSPGRRNISHSGVADILLFSSSQFIFPPVLQEEYITSYRLLLSVTLFWPQEYNILNLFLKCPLLSCIVYWPQSSGMNSKKCDMTKTIQWKKPGCLYHYIDSVDFNNQVNHTLCMPFILSLSK